MSSSRNLVIDGETLAFPAVSTANFDGDRVALPARLVDRLALRGKDPIECLLIVMSVGRYRVVLSPAAGEALADPGLAKLLSKWKAIGSSEEFLEAELSNGRAAVRARVMPSSISPMGSGWRITVPKEAKSLVRDDHDSSFLFILSVGKFVELWFPETLRQAVSTPLTEVLR